jgi:peptide/nickel transport system permease protein
LGLEGIPPAPFQNTVFAEDVTMRFLLRRTGFYLIAAFVAITLNFLIPRLMTGDPASIIFARFQGRLDARAMDSLRDAFGFTQAPLHEQFFMYLENLAQGNLGISVANFPQPVISVIGTALGWTLRLIGLATIFSFGFGILLGIISSWRRGGFVDSYMLPVLSVLGAFPYFWVALVFLYFFGMNLGWFPLGHAFDIDLTQNWGSPEFLGSVVKHAVMPVLTILITSIGGWMLGMRNNMIGVLSQDYITMAEAKGLSERRVMFSYAARNAILPSLTGFAMSLGFILGGALLVEIVFSYPGMGFLLLSAVNQRDYPLMQGIFLLITLSVLIA